MAKIGAAMAAASMPSRSRSKWFITSRITEEISAGKTYIFWLVKRDGTRRKAMSRIIVPPVAVITASSRHGTQLSSATRPLSVPATAHTPMVMMSA